MADDGIDPSIVTIFTTEELGPVIQQLGTIFLIDHPGTTFQYTAKPSDFLSNRVDDGVRPALWIDRSEVLAPYAKDGFAIGPAQPVGDDPMQFVVFDEYKGPEPTLESFGTPGGPAPTGLCKADIPCGEGARKVLEREGITPDPDETLESGKDVVGRLADETIATSIIYRSDAARLYTKFDYLALPDPTVALRTYQSMPLRENPVATEFQSWLATSPEAEPVLLKAGLRARDKKP